MNLRQKLALGAVIGLFCLAVFHTANKKLVSSSEEAAIPSPFVSPTRAASPSPSPTETPQPLVGYCLNAPILMYHHVQPQKDAEAKGQKNINVDTAFFEGQMAYLKSKGYTTLTVEQVANALINKQALPVKNITLTFDDGYDDFYTNAYPILKKYGLVANIMIPTGLIGNVGYMRWDRLKELTGGGLVFAYDHTWSHAALGTKPLEKIDFEVMTSKKQLEDNLGKSVNVFAYPYGSKSQTVIDFLKSHGFIAAVSSLPGYTQCDSFIMMLHRSRVGNTSLSSYGI